MRMLDLFCGRFGWGKAFAARGWEVIGIDLAEPPEAPEGCTIVKADVLSLWWENGTCWRAGIPVCRDVSFICASSPCEQFSVHGMKHFHPNPKYPEMGIRLFNHTRALCEASGVPYVMENVRAAQQFVGRAAHHCGPFYLWGTGVPPLMPQGVKKGMDTAGALAARGATRDEMREYSKAMRLGGAFNSKSPERKEISARIATIPPELAGAVADYATRLCEVTA